MIIDSHAHYNNNAYKKPFRHLVYGQDGYALREGNWPEVAGEIAGSEHPGSYPQDSGMERCLCR